MRCKHYFCQLTRPPSYRQSIFRISTLVNKGKVGWVFAWLQADSNAAAGYRSHCVRCTVVDWVNCEWRLTERFVKMPRKFTHEEYADMIFVYGYYNGNANAAVDEYRRRYPLRRTPNRAVFTSVFCALRECGTLPSVHVSVIRTQSDTNS